MSGHSTGRYRNPLARGGDFADPFVLRHDGRYYLYATNADVRCWSSDDLVTWQAHGPTIDADVFAGLVPFAPEVVYDDGAFFMYTSPSGFGHIVLRASSPTGPFEPVSGNVGHAIDGHVFTDDDGRRYFYWAGDEGIWACELRGPAEFGEPVLTGIHMNGWTEGPFVLKRDGVYLMTLTGNHYLSPGYRIDAAWSRDPLRGWQGDRLNPILVSTRGDLTGLGHSSSVVGPDLVSTWIAYHNFNPDASRDLDLDRQVHTGASLQVLGPTRSAPVPAPPDAAVDWAGDGIDQWRTDPGVLTVENGRGVLRGVDARAHWTVEAGATWTAEVVLIGEGRLIIDATPLDLPSSLDPAVLHTWRVEAEHGVARVLVDGRRAGEVALAAGIASRIAVEAIGSEVRLGSCALTRQSPAESDRASLKPVPGRFWAALSADGSTAPHRATVDGGADRVHLSAGSAIVTELDVPEAGHYRVHVAGSFAVGDELLLSVAGGSERQTVESATTLLSWTVVLTDPRVTLLIEGVSGAPVLDLVTIARAPHPGPPEVADKRLAGDAKLVLPGQYDDVVVTARVRVRFDAPDAHADLLVRATQLSDGGEGDDPVLGTDFFLGYSVQLHSDRVTIARHDYGQRELAAHPVAVDDSVPHELRIRAVGGSISVDLDGEHILAVDDVLPHVIGHVGLRTARAQLSVETLRFGER